jgi:hypothetical protein
MGESPLHKACMNTTAGRQLVQLMTRCGVNVNVPNSNGETPLHYAVRLLREDLVYLLLAAGADPNIRGRDGRTILSIAQREAAQTRIADILARPEAYAAEFGGDAVAAVTREQLCQACGSRTATTSGMLCDVCQQMTSLGTSSRDTMMQLRAPQKLTLLTLPLSILVKILEFGSDRRLCALAQVSLKLRIVAANNENWYNLCLTNCCSRCARCFKWSHSVSPIDTDATGRQVPPLFGFYKNYYKEKFERCIMMSDQPQAMRRTMHRRCIFCSGARRDPGVPPPRMPNEPAHGEPLAVPDYERAAGQASSPMGLRENSSAHLFQTGTFRAPDNARPTAYDLEDAEAALDSIPVGASAGTMATMMPQHGQGTQQMSFATQSGFAGDGHGHGGGAVTMGTATLSSSQMQPQPGYATAAPAGYQQQHQQQHHHQQQQQQQQQPLQAAPAPQQAATPFQPQGQMLFGAGAAPRRAAQPAAGMQPGGAALAAPAVAGATVPRVSGAALYGGGGGGGTGAAAPAPTTLARSSVHQPDNTNSSYMPQQHHARSNTAPPPASSTMYIPPPQQQLAPSQQQQQQQQQQQPLQTQSYDPYAMPPTASRTVSLQSQFSTQIGTLRQMGFSQSDEECARALAKAHGNVDTAVGILLSQ